MPKKQTKYLSLAVLTLTVISFASCGGGGSGGGDDVFDISGLWTGALTKTADTCNPANPQTLNFSHNVAQNEDAVTLVSSDGRSYLGNLVGGNGLSVDNSRTVQVGGNNCQEDSRIEYDGVSSDSDATADVEFTSTITCTGPGGCTTTYTGTGTRQVTAQPTPTTVPGATNTPTGGTTGGCAAINPNTASGTYEGDGGCGISDAAFTFEQQGTEGVVTLEPFGTNGLTSFVISAENSSVATSRRTDLEINGETGYTCTMTCSPTITFTVRCTLEGGESCTEKF